jgi:hypothetical protein
MSVSLPNLPYFVAAARGIPVIAWGGTGVAKTAINESYSTNKLGRKFHAFLATHHLPEEVSGTPVVFREEMLVKMLPLDWVDTLTQPNAWLMLDEFNTGSSMMRALLLSVLNERRIGTLRLHPSLIITAAANPPDMAPNAAPMEGSVANRFMHWQWETPVQSFLDGIENDEFTVPDYPVPENAELAEPTWGRKIRLFLESKPEFLETKTIEPDVLSFPSLRTWRYVKRGCAGLDAVQAPASAYLSLVSGCVGKTAAALFIQFATSLDLFSAVEVMEGRATVDLDAPIDRLIHLPSSLIFHAQRLAKDGKLETGMVDNAFLVLLGMGEKGHVDAVKKPLAQIATIRPDYRPPAAYRQRFGQLIAQIM